MDDMSKWVIRKIVDGGIGRLYYSHEGLCNEPVKNKAVMFDTNERAFVRLYEGESWEKVKDDGSSLDNHNCQHHADHSDRSVDYLEELGMDTRNLSEGTVRLLCQEYVDLLNGPVNGWGQHIHPIYGNSHTMLRFLHRNGGEKEVNSILEEIFEKEKKDDQA